MMTAINAFLAARGIYMLTLLLLALGVAGVIVCNNYMKKLICMNVMQVAVIFFFLCFGQKDPGTIPVAMSEAVTACGQSWYDRCRSFTASQDQGKIRDHRRG